MESFVFLFVFSNVLHGYRLQSILYILYIYILESIAKHMVGVFITISYNHVIHIDFKYQDCLIDVFQIQRKKTDPGYPPNERRNI